MLVGVAAGGCLRATAPLGVVVARAYDPLVDRLVYRRTYVDDLASSALGESTGAWVRPGTGRMAVGDGGSTRKGVRGGTQR
jgi:hypothetical protein